jgi:hypothetical protein
MFGETRESQVEGQPERNEQEQIIQSTAGKKRLAVSTPLCPI